MLIEDDLLRAFVIYVLQEKLMELEKEGARKAFKRTPDNPNPGKGDDAQEM